jgi:hypothetical protein
VSYPVVGGSPNYGPLWQPYARPPSVVPQQTAVQRRRLPVPTASRQAGQTIISGGLGQISYGLEWCDAGYHRYWRIRKPDANAETAANYSEVQFFDAQPDPFVDHYDIFAGYIGLPSQPLTLDKHIKANPLPTAPKPVLTPELYVANPTLGGGSGNMTIRAVRLNQKSSPGISAAFLISPSGPISYILNNPSGTQNSSSLAIDGSAQVGSLSVDTGAAPTEKIDMSTSLDVALLDGLKGPTRFTNTANSTNISATAAQTAFSKSFTIPANYLRAGSVVRVFAEGLWQTGVTAGPTITFFITAAGNPFYQSSPMPQAISITTLVTGWGCRGQFTMRAVGTAQTAAIGYGQAYAWNSSTPQYQGSPNIAAGVAGSRTFSLTTTGTILLQVQVQMNVNAAANSALMTNMVVEIDHAYTTA